MVGEFTFKSNVGHAEVDRLTKQVYLKAKWHSVQGQSLVIRMSKVKFADYTALARLLCLVEGMGRQECAAMIMLPKYGLSEGELEFLGGAFGQLSEPLQQQKARELVENLEKRAGQRHFLISLGFVRALESLKQRSAITIVEDQPLDITNVLRQASSPYVHSVIEAALSIKPGNTNPPANRSSNSIYPFSWFGQGDLEPGAVTALIHRLVDYLYSLRVATTRSDALTLANSVVKELLENVEAHANIGESTKLAPLALLGAIRMGKSLANWEPYEVEQLGRRLQRKPIGETWTTVVVGDSGAGIATTLRHSYEAHTANTQRRRNPRAVDVLRYSLRAAASRFESERPRGLGLTAVVRHVRSFNGHLAIRSGNGALKYLSTAQGVDLVPKTAPYVPGTILEIHLGPRLERRAFSAIRSEGSIPMTVLRCTLRELSQLEDLIRAGQEADESGSAALILLVEEWPLQGRLASSMAAALRSLAAGLENSQPLVIITLDTVSGDIAPAFLPLDDWNDVTAVLPATYRAQTWTPPFLVIGSDGGSMWTGGSEKVRRMLYMLSEADRPIGSVDLIPPMRRRTAEYEYWLSHPLWIDKPDSQTYSLRIRIEDINYAVVSQTSEWLANSSVFIANGSRADHYLLRRHSGSIGYSISTQFRNLSRSREVKPNVAKVVVWQHVDGAITERLMQCLGIKDYVVVNDGQLALPADRLSPFTPNEEVFLLVDYINTGRTAVSLLEYAWRMGATPLCVMTVRDGRGPGAGSVRTFNGRIPVISAHQYLVHGNGEGPWLGRATPPTAERPQILADAAESALFLLIEDSNIYLSHIERGFRRHFSSYISIGAIVEEGTVASLAVVNDMEGNLAVASLRSVWIIYPVAQDGYAEQLVSLVTTALEDKYDHLSVSQLPVDLEDPEETSLFPERDQVAVIFDWGAVTAETSRRLLEYAARSGVVRAHTCVLTSQMTKNQEDALRAVSQYKLTGHTTSTIPAGSQLLLSVPDEVRPNQVVDVSISFLARVPIGMRSGKDCYLCEMAHRFLVHRGDAPLALLRAHASRKWEIFRPRRRDEVLSAPASDVLGVRIDADASHQIWTLRRLLVEALEGDASSVGAATLLLDYLTGPSSDSWCLALTRLLAIEPYWLHRWPLDVPSVREMLARSALAMLKTIPLGDRAESFAWQSVMLLRGASKVLFVEQFGELLDRFYSFEAISGELVYGMYTLLDRPYHQLGNGLNLILVGLLDGRDRLSERRRTSAGTDRDLFFGVSMLYRRAVALQDGADVVDTPSSSWHHMQARYATAMRTHARAITSMLNVLSCFSGPVATRSSNDPDYLPPSAQWLAASTHWADCASFLASSVFPYIGRIRRVLEAIAVHSERPDLDSMIDFDIVRAERFGDQLEALARRPHDFTEVRRRDLELEAQLWFRHFLRAPDLSAKTDPTLLRLLTEVPAYFEPSWSSAVEAAEAQGAVIGVVRCEIEPGMRVFCGRTTLNRILRQIVLNAAGDAHAAPDRPLSGCDFLLESAVVGERLVVSIRNNWSVPNPASQGGLTFLESELNAYGGELVRSALRPTSDSDWAYRVDLYFTLLDLAEDGVQ